MRPHRLEILEVYCHNLGIMFLPSVLTPFDPPFWLNWAVFVLVFSPMCWKRLRTSFTATKHVCKPMSFSTKPYPSTIFCIFKLDTCVWTATTFQQIILEPCGIPFLEAHITGKLLMELTKHFLTNKFLQIIFISCKNWVLMTFWPSEIIFIDYSTFCLLTFGHFENSKS